MKSLKFKLSLVTNVIAIIALVILGVVGFLFTKNALFKTIENTEINAIKVAKTDMEDFRAKNLSSLQKLSKDILSLPLEKINSQEALMANIGDMFKSYKHSSNLLAVYIGLANGSNVVSDIESEKNGKSLRINGKNNGYDATTREWYQGARNTNSVYVQPYYVDLVSNETIFTYSKALYKDGQFIGVLAIDVSLKMLQKTFESKPGNAFLIDKNNNIFVASNPSEMNSGFQNTSLLLENLKQYGKFQPFLIEAGGVENLGMCSPVLNYTACITEPTDKIYQSINKIALIQIILVLITVALSTILMYFIVSRY
ncbi:cache domain-containing protein, partial [Campylobacter sp. 2457A]|uniref:cache domain-containing protein n=1 Tax=Campylobacter sp. 2457A TaxID=2735784 RepID=UPI00301D96FF|nr:methyl-accepting chemotaxis protein [Campylobacter sp. 2457A]